MLTLVQDPSKAASETPLDNNGATQLPKVRTKVAYDTNILDHS